MVRQIGLILGTYVRRPSGKESLIPVAGVFCLFVATLIAVAHQGHATLLESSTPTFGVAITFVAFPMWQRLRQHLLCERRGLLPNYILPHSVVFAMLAGLLVLAWPLLLGELSGIDPLGLIACMATLFGLTGMAVVSPPVFILPVWGVAYLAFCFIPTAAPIRLLLTGMRPDWSIGISAAAIASIGVVFRILVDRQKISPEPGHNLDWRPFSLGKSFIVTRPSRIGILAMSKRWRKTIRLNWWFTPGFVVFFLLQPKVLIQQHNDSAMGVEINALIFSAVAMMSTIGIIVVWQTQWKFREVDLLRPVTRKRFYQENGAAIATQTLLYCLILAIVFIVADSTWQKINIKEWAIQLLMTMCSEVLVYGFLLRGISFRSLSFTAVVVGIPTCFAIVGAVGLLATRPSPYVTLPGTVLMLVAGLAMVRTAYRRWLRVELG